MLPCRAARVLRRPSSSNTFRAVARPQWVRSYGKDDKLHRAPPKPPAHARTTDSVAAEGDVTSQGPVRNRTWSPDKPLRFAPGYNPQEQATTLGDESIPGAPIGTVHVTSNAPTRSSASPLDATQQVISPEPALPRTSRKIPPRGLEPESVSSPAESKQQIFPSKLREGSTEPPYGSVASETTTEQAPTRPLPDLRQGIPSTFDTDFSDKSSSFKTQDSEAPELNLTADPASGGGRRGEDDLRKEEYVSSIERRRNALAKIMYSSFAAFAVTAALFLGQNWDSEEAKAHPDAPNGWDPQSFYARIKERLGSQLGYYTEPTFPKLLPDMDPAQRAPYTLVLSLEDLLVSSKWSRTKGWEVAKRPGVDYFIRYMSQYYELVIFTSVPMMNAELVIRKLDPFRLIMWPLFREATRYMNGEHVKDLSYLNRDLSKTLIIDTVAAHTQLQPENAITLPKWDGARTSAGTNDLVALIPFLEYIASMSIEDVRKVLESYKGTHIPTEFHRRESVAREAFNKRLAEEKAKRPRLAGGSGIMGGLSSALGFKPTAALMQVPGEVSPMEGFAQGKMLSDQMRERGLRNYEQLEKEIRENGETWLKEMEKEEKKAQEEQMKSMQSGVAGMFSVFGGNPGGESRS